MATLGSIAVKLGLDPSQFRNGLIRARAELSAFKASVDSVALRTDNFGKKLVDSALSASKFALTAGAAASAAITMVPHLVGAWHAVEGFAKAAGAAAPALLALGAGAGFVKFALVRIGPEVLRSFDPILDMFNKTGDAASKLAARGLPALAEGFAKANAPAFAQGMNMVALSTNQVVSGFLDWGKSAAGVEAIRNLTYSTGLATLTLVPHINQLVESFGNMIGRIAGVSMAAGASGLSGVLDRLSQWMDRVNAATVSSGIAKLKSDYEAVKSAIVGVVDKGRELYTMWQQNREAIGRVQDGLAILALFTGPLGLLVGGAGLLARHWSEIKSTVEPFIGPFVTALSNMLAQLAPLVPTIAALAASFLQWGTVLAAVLTPFLSILVGLIQVLAPILVPLAPVILTIVGAMRLWTIAQTALNLAMLANPFVLIVALIVGLVATIVYAWNNCQTFRDIVTGVWHAVVGVITGAVNAIRGVLNWFGSLPGLMGGWWNSAVNAVAGAIGALLALAGGIPGRILGAIGNLGALLFNAGRNVIQGLINGIMSMISAVGSAIGSVASKIRNALPFSPAKEGPLSGRGSPDIAGAKIVQMLSSGMLRALPEVAGAAARLAGAVGPIGTDVPIVSIPTPRGVTEAQASGALGGGPGAPSGGTIRFDGPPAILEFLRKLIRDNGGLDLALGGRG